MTINIQQVYTLKKLIEFLGELDLSEGIDNDSSTYIKCNCPILKRTYIINDIGECWFNDSLVIDRDGVFQI
jgi:hypothetical protein